MTLNDTEDDSLVRLFKRNSSNIWAANFCNTSTATAELLVVTAGRCYLLSGYRYCRNLFCCRNWILPLRAPIYHFPFYTAFRADWNPRFKLSGTSCHHCRLSLPSSVVVTRRTVLGWLTPMSFSANSRTWYFVAGRSELMTASRFVPANRSRVDDTFDHVPIQPLAQYNCRSYLPPPVECLSKQLKFTKCRIRPDVNKSEAL